MNPIRFLSQVWNLKKEGCCQFVTLTQLLKSRFLSQVYHLKQNQRDSQWRRLRLLSKCVFVMGFAVGSTGYSQEEFFHILKSKTPPFSLKVSQEKIRSTPTQNWSDRAEYMKVGAEVTIPTMDTELRSEFLQLKMAQHDFTFENKDPNSPLPDRLYEASVGYSMFFNKEVDHSWGLNFKANSHADKIYANSHVTDLQVSGLSIHRKSWTSTWVWSLNYSSRRHILADHVPLPGFQYIYTPDPNLFLILGFPANGFSWKFYGPLRLSYFTFILAHQAKLSYEIFYRSEIYTQFSYSPTTFFLRDEPDKNKKIYMESKKWTLGYKMPLGENLILDVFAGRIYDFRIYQTKNYGKPKDWLEELATQSFFNVQLGIQI